MEEQSPEQIVQEKNKGAALFLILCAIWIFGMITVHTLEWYHVIPDMRAIDRVCGGVRDLGGGSVHR